MLNLEEMIGFDESVGFHSIEIWITACDLDEKSFETVEDIVRRSFPCRIILSASYAELTSTSFSPGT